MYFKYSKKILKSKIFFYTKKIYKKIKSVVFSPSGPEPEGASGVMIFFKKH